MRSISKYFFAFLFLFSTAHAALRIELTQGVNAAIPIIIVPFQDQANNVPGNTTISQVISTDLQNSGQFLIKPLGKLALLPIQSSVDTSYWRKQGASDIVTGRVQQEGDHYVVSFQLIDLYAIMNQGAASAILLNDSFLASQSALRGLAHHISDLIYEKLTGVRGIFNTKIAYVLAQRVQNGTTRYQLVVADQDGFHPQVLLTSSEPMMSPTWMPNGRFLAYVSFENHQAAIYLQNLATGARELLSRFPGINGAPAFSPNGHRMALVLTLNGNPNIYVMNLATKKLTQITNDYSINTEPVWSRNGNTLFFSSDRAGGLQIYRYNFATGETERVTFDGDYNARACLTPQDHTLVMMHRDNGNFNIAKQDLSSGRLTVLTNSGSDDSPRVAPHGQMILYGTRLDGRSVLGLVSLDGRVKLRLPSEAGDVQDPSWSPYL